MCTLYECENAKHTLYVFTVKDNREDVTDYKPFIDRAEKLGCKISEYYYENDTKNRLHIHGIMSIPKGFYRKKLLMKGLHLKLEEIYDKEGWQKYIRKEQKELDEPDTPIEDCKPMPKGSLFN